MGKIMILPVALTIITLCSSFSLIMNILIYIPFICTHLALFYSVTSSILVSIRPGLVLRKIIASKVSVFEYAVQGTCVFNLHVHKCRRYVLRLFN